MDAMLKYQDESGMWYQVVNFGGMDKNYLETSGSSIMAYALLKGVRLGFCRKAIAHTVRRLFMESVITIFPRMKMETSIWAESVSWQA